ncbi:ABC transporter ATP-binding protein [Jiangella asiatica]|uniref:ABC transporter ATP-binding protein n=1 Tax=Jiangella asiatica TaxID=2530372 RepID=UPI001EF1537F|nr:oligopeptide/dipeptide ABC transporter ATP-binding protein [Jiangella asiatica]
MTEQTTVTDDPARLDQDTLLRVENVSMDFPIRSRGLFSRTTGHVHAVNDVSLEIRSGEVLGLVGESGCGKTTLGRCIVGTNAPTGGSILYRKDTGDVVDLAAMSKKDRSAYQSEIRVVFQDPFTSLNPRMTILQIVGDPLKNFASLGRSEIEDRVAHMLQRVGLSPTHMHRYPHAFSGGERQRVNIARALVAEPRLVIADEAVSALDVSVRAQILNLLRDLQDEFNLTYLFISHDLSVVENICDRVAVMYLGKIVEIAETDDLYSAPRHPYTEALLAAVPKADPRLRGTGRRVRLSDEFPDPSNPPSGCFFHTRCSYADDDRCAHERPLLRTVAGVQQAACHYADELDLAGVGTEAGQVEP